MERGGSGDGPPRRANGAARRLPVQPAQPGNLERVLDLTDPALVGLAVDTGELTVAGMTRRSSSGSTRIASGMCSSRTLWPSMTPRNIGNRMRSTRSAHVAGPGEIPRWFAEPGGDGGLVIFGSVQSALTDIGYTGWIVFESDQSPHPATSALLGGYFLQTELSRWARGQ